MIFIDPTGTYWYIYALLIYLLITWIFSSAPKITLIISLLLFSLTIFLGESNFLMKLTLYYPLFLLGHLTSGFVLEKSKKINIYHIVFPVLYFIALTFVKDTILMSNPAVVLTVNCGGIISGIIVAVLLARTQPFNWLSKIGQNTLPIYVLHFAPLGALKIVLPSIISNQPELAVILMLISDILFQLFIVKLSNRFGLDWLFTMPRPFTNKNRKPAPN